MANSKGRIDMSSPALEIKNLEAWYGESHVLHGVDIVVQPGEVVTLLENVRLGLQRKLGTSFHFWRSERSLQQLDERAMQLLTEVGLDDLADEVTVNLPYGRKRALEIATTLSMEPELMLLDEPTQGMGHEDVDRVTQLIKKVSAGRTILMVEHNMKVISTIADRITVLQRGAVLAEGRYEEVSRNPQVMEAYMGTTDGQLQGAH